MATSSPLRSSLSLTNQATRPVQQQQQLGAMSACSQPGPAAAAVPITCVDADGGSPEDHEGAPAGRMADHQLAVSWRICVLEQSLFVILKLHTFEAVEHVKDPLKLVRCYSSAQTELVPHFDIVKNTVLIFILQVCFIDRLYIFNRGLSQLQYSQPTDRCVNMKCSSTSMYESNWKPLEGGERPVLSSVQVGLCNGCSECLSSGALPMSCTRKLKCYHATS